MNYRMMIAGSAALAALAAQASPAVADLVRAEFPDPQAPETNPLLLAGLVFVLLVSGISFLLLGRMARKRAARAATMETAANADTGSLPESAPQAPEALNGD